MTVDANRVSLLRPIIGIENRTAQEVFDIMCDRFRLAARPASDHAGLVDVARAFHDGPLMADDHEFDHDSEQGKWCIEVAQFFAMALSAQASPAPLEGVRVKPLVWKEDRFGAEAKTSMGRYFIEDMGSNWTADRYWLQDADTILGKFDTMELAKSEAWSCHQRRILSAIVGSAK